ncbi:hypothetical protein D3Z45_00890 [Lachnospiraceae bacterium]|nr:hypothetical protein [Lachnospiraceae bacterium]
MGSNVKRIIILLILFMFVSVGGIVLYANIQSSPEVEETAGIEESVTENAEPMQIGDDTRAFLGDETFFEPDKQPYSSIEKMDGKNLSLLMTSVQKDLRIQIVDNAGKLVTGEEFCVVLNGDKEYKDEDKDGIIYIEYLRAGEYEVALKEAEGYRVPETNAHINVKQSVEYVVIDDIDLLILSEDEVNVELEDLEANGAADDADKSEITGMQEGNATAKMGIDVSKWNKEIDWDKVKEAGVEFAIIRVGYRGATTGALIEDPYFEANIKGAIRAGIPVGVYFFTQAVNTVEAVEEASMVTALCRDYKISYPVFIDVEGLGGSGRADGLDVETRTAVSKAFCATMESAGYRAGVYSSRNWLNDMLDMNELRDYVVWLAEYRDVPIYQGYYHMWQYTSKGSVDGIEGNVDFNLSYLRIEDTVTSILQEEELEEQEGEEEAAETPEEVPEDEITEPKPIEGAENAEW